MPSGAVRLPGAAAVTAAAAGVVTAEPSWMAERRRRGNPSGVGPAQPPVAVAVEDVRTPDTPLVACPRPLSAGRTSVHWVGRTSGVQRDRCPTRPARSWCPDGHASGDRGPGVRAVRTALDPGMRRCGGAAHVRARRVRYVAVVGEWLGRRCPELGSGGEGMVVGSAVPGSDRVDGRPAACPVWIRGGCGVALAAGPTWELVQRRVPVGWLGARAGAAAHTSPCRCVLDRLPV
jgi:hypothetical protein